MIGKQPKAGRSIFWPGLAAAVLVAILLRTFAFEPFTVETEAMVPTLTVGDYVLAAKYTYGFNRYSFPVLHPPFVGQIWGGLPTRGDVVVLHVAARGDRDVIRRIVGLPGDVIDWGPGGIAVNGVLIHQEPIADYLGEAPSTIRMPQVAETVHDRQPYAVLTDPKEEPPAVATTGHGEVPPDHVFVLSDNRRDHDDSRQLDRIGFVPLDRVVGCVLIRFFSMRSGARWWEFWSWSSKVRRDHLMTWVR